MGKEIYTAIANLPEHLVTPEIARQPSKREISNCWTAFRTAI